MDYRKILAAQGIEARNVDDRADRAEAAPDAVPPPQTAPRLASCDLDELGLTALVERLALAIRTRDNAR